MTTNYPTKLTDAQYDAIVAIICDKRKRKNSLREVLNSIFYHLKTGCHWRMLPSDFPKWQTVYYHFSKWSNDGTIEELNDLLRNRTRMEAGRVVSTSTRLIDSQSIKTTRRGGIERGFDGGKKVNGRKRHIVTDTMGLVLSVVVHTSWSA
jgi:putative transposase